MTHGYVAQRPGTLFLKKESVGVLGRPAQDHRPDDQAEKTRERVGHLSLRKRDFKDRRPISNITLNSNLQLIFQHSLMNPINI